MPYVCPVRDGDVCIEQAKEDMYECHKQYLAPPVTFDTDVHRPTTMMMMAR